MSSISGDGGVRSLRVGNLVPNSVAMFNGTDLNTVVNTGVQFLNETDMQISKIVTGNILIKNLPGFPNPEIFLWREDTSKGLKLRINAPDNQLEVIDVYTSNYGILNGNAIPGFFDQISTMNEDALTTTFEVRMSYSWVHSVAFRGNVMAHARFAISPGEIADNPCDFEAYIRLWDITNDVELASGAVAAASDTAVTSLTTLPTYSAFLSVGLASSQKLTPTYAYGLELLMRRTNAAAGPYYPKKGSLEMHMH